MAMARAVVVGAAAAAAGRQGAAGRVLRLLALVEVDAVPRLICGLGHKGRRVGRKEGRGTCRTGCRGGDGDGRRLLGGLFLAQV